MKTSGIVRKVDELGRIVIPKEMRNMLDIANGDPVEINIDGDRVFLTKYQPNCIFCGSEQRVVAFRDKRVCLDCLEDIKKETF